MTWIKAVTSIVPAAVNTVASLVKDKKKRKEKDPFSATEFAHEQIEKGIALSSTRVAQICGGGALITAGLSYLETDKTTGLILIGLGVALAVAMQIFKKKEE